SYPRPHLHEISSYRPHRPSCLILQRFFLNAPPTSELHPLSLHDALPICVLPAEALPLGAAMLSCAKGSTGVAVIVAGCARAAAGDRKSTRLNSSHQIISYAVFCLKKTKSNT